MSQEPRRVKLERAWQQGRLPAWSLGVLTCAIVAGLAGSAWLVWRFELELAELVIARGRLDQQLSSRQNTSFASVPSFGDFTRGLPLEPDSTDVVRRLHALCIASGAELGNVEIVLTPASARALGKVSLRGELTGGYTATRQVLADLLERVPGAVIESIRWHAVEPSHSIVASIQLSIWYEPSNSAFASGVAAP